MMQVFTVLHVPLLDFEWMDVLSHLEECIAFIDKARQDNVCDLCM